MLALLCVSSLYSLYQYICVVSRPSSAPSSPLVRPCARPDSIGNAGNIMIYKGCGTPLARPFARCKRDA